jgi:hypothetical protein
MGAVMPLRLLRRSGIWARGFGLVCAYALALQVVLGGFAAPRAAHAATSGLLVLCHGDEAAVAPSAPTEPQPAHVCQFCCISGGAALDAAAPALVSPVSLVFADWIGWERVARARPSPAGAHYARGPPALV